MVYLSILVVETFEKTPRAGGGVVGDCRSVDATESGTGSRGGRGGSPISFFSGGIGNRERSARVFTNGEEIIDPGSASRIHRVDNSVRRGVRAAQSVDSEIFETRGESVQDTEDTQVAAEKREEVGETFGAK